MEIIYDHSVTEQELAALFGPEEDRLTRDEYLRDAQSMRDTSWVLADLYRLYLLRGDSQKAAHHLYQIKNIRYRRSVWLIDRGPIPEHRPPLLQNPEYRETQAIEKAA